MKIDGSLSGTDTLGPFRPSPKQYCSRGCLITLYLTGVLPTFVLTPSPPGDPQTHTWKQGTNFSCCPGRGGDRYTGQGESPRSNTAKTFIMWGLNTSQVKSSGSFGSLGDFLTVWEIREGASSPHLWVAWCHLVTVLSKYSLSYCYFAVLPYCALLGCNSE